MSYGALAGAMSWLKSPAAEGLGAHHVAVLVALADHHNAETGRLDPSLRRLSETAKTSESKARRCLQDLVERGAISREARYDDRGRQTSSSYAPIFALLGEGVPQTPRGVQRTGGGCPTDRGEGVPQTPKPRKKEPGKKNHSSPNPSGAGVELNGLDDPMNPMPKNPKRPDRLKTLPPGCPPEPFLGYGKRWTAVRRKIAERGHFRWLNDADPIPAARWGMAFWVAHTWGCSTKTADSTINPDNRLGLDDIEALLTWAEDGRAKYGFDEKVQHPVLGMKKDPKTMWRHLGWFSMCADRKQGIDDED